VAYCKVLSHRIPKGMKQKQCKFQWWKPASEQRMEPGAYRSWSSYANHYTDCWL